jgi:glycogen debranching enzyme
VIPSELLLRVFPDLLFAYQGQSLLIVDRRTGCIDAGLQGVYEHDLRLLSRYALLVNGRQPRLDALSAVRAWSMLAYYVCPPTPEDAASLDATGPLPQEKDRQVVLRLARYVGGGFHEDLDVANHGLTPARLQLAWELATDFADLNEVRAGGRQQEAPIETSWRVSAEGDGELRFDYRHPDLPRGTMVRLHARGARLEWDGTCVTCLLTLAPRARHRVCVELVPIVDGSAQEPLHGCDAFAARWSTRDQTPHSWTTGATRLETSNAVVKWAWDRAIGDLSALALWEGQTTLEGVVPAAGYPFYGALFGRDALTASGQVLMASPRLAEGSLRRLARHLGTKDDPFYDEEPGRVAQQLRDDPLALLGITPWAHYYGDYAAPCAFLVALGGHHLVTGDAEFAREMLDPARRVLEWLDTRADLDGDGFLEYQTRSPRGQKQQGWKDSDEGVVYADGTPVEPPVAACEIQGYWYAAKLLMAEVFLSLGEPAQAYRLVREASDLKTRFNRSFWMPEERFIAFGLDPHKRLITSIASNAGHCLATGIVDGQHAPDVVRRLLAPDMFSGWGIRTLSAEHPAYNPFKYHLGSVWPSENATIAFGMKRYGFGAECNAVARGIFDAAALFEHHRLPEALGGLPRDELHPHPGVYPDANAPQAWSASAVIWLIQSMLGLWSYAPLNVLVVEPELPEWLPELTLRDLRINDARVSIQFRRDHSGRTDYRVLERNGTIRVLRQPPPEALGIGPLSRLRELVESLLAGH